MSQKYDEFATEKKNKQRGAIAESFKIENYHLHKKVTVLEDNLHLFRQDSRTNDSWCGKKAALLIGKTKCLHLPLQPGNVEVVQGLKSKSCHNPVICQQEDMQWNAGVLSKNFARSSDKTKIFINESFSPCFKEFGQAKTYGFKYKSKMVRFCWKKKW